MSLNYIRSTRSIAYILPRNLNRKIIVSISYLPHKEKRTNHRLARAFSTGQYPTVNYPYDQTKRLLMVRIGFEWLGGDGKFSMLQGQRSCIIVGGIRRACSISLLNAQEMKQTNHMMMMSLTDFAIFSCISFSLAFLLSLIFRKKPSEPRPPGPPAWPVIGNILDVGMMPHQNFHKLRAKYGPVLWLKLGMSNALVVQSAKAAEVLFKKNDYAFSDRMVPDSLTACGYDKGSLAIANQGEYCRMVRKLCTSELLASKKISASAQVRQNCIDIMMKWIKDDAQVSRVNGGSGEIEVDKYITVMTFNLIANFMISRDIMDSIAEGNAFTQNMDKFMGWNGVPNLSDTFPFLKWIDPQGVRRNSGKYLGKCLEIISGFVTERIQQIKSVNDYQKKDFLDALLENNQRGETDDLSEKNIAIIILEMFIAGTETTSTTILWGMSELLGNPQCLKKLKDELDLVTGHSRKVEESDISKLPYLQAMVKETMRLHPSVPLLLPRKAFEDADFMGYNIPKNTTVLVNAWAIHRDLDVWEDPLSFKPERFINSNVDLKGQHFELIPFGSGRRSCIGMLLGEKMVSITIAKLVQSFDWKLPANESPGSMDMRERMGLALRKLVPLKVIPIERKLTILQ